ncbi:UvrD-helicase domain-containing protein [Buchnera aphidicola (Ceratoglyphina bambusae)]|uniref:UvrD-helicase domain-containing protein n=1 Tax=Buchnera aphidicola TaxID=9 RepID=UPI0031B836BB
MLLNFFQNYAVKFISKPCLVIAGAGSGKTRVIINKIIYLINDCGFNSKDIFALTFTNKAANEMKDRIKNVLGEFKSNNLHISTFHSLGIKILRLDRNNLYTKSNFSIFDRYEQNIILKEITKNFLNKDLNLLKKLIFFISKCKNKLIDSYIAKKHAKNSLEHIFANCYEIYEKYLRNLNILDFDDLVFLPVLLLKKDKNLRNYFKRKIKYLLVDEYQDTNVVQYKLIKLLNNSKNFTLVGDDDQSIYSWRGANPKNFFLLNNDYPKLKIIKLEHNYRSSGRILHVANSLISNNSHLFSKKLFSNFSYGSFIKIISARNELDECNRVADEIIKYNNIYNNNYNDFAVLYRNNQQSRILEKILLTRSIPYKIFSNISLFNILEIKFLLNYLKLIINPNNDFSFLQVVNVPNRKIGKITLSKLIKWSKRNKTSLFKSCLDKNINTKINNNSYNNLRKFGNWFTKILVFSSSKPSKVLYKIIKDINYIDWLKKRIKNSEKFNFCIKNINLFLKWFEDFFKKKKKKNYKIIFQEIIENLLIDDNNLEKNNRNFINLMTLHSSKGLEFNFVFIIGLEEGIIPHYSNLSNSDIDEERRLMYVGITRAKKQLTLTFSKIRQKYGEKIFTTPSRFLYELPKKDLKWI